MDIMDCTSTTQSQTNGGRPATFSDISNLLFITRKIRERTPKRWDIISNYMKLFNSTNSTRTGPVINDLKMPEISPKHLSKFWNNILDKYPNIVEQSDEQCFKLFYGDVASNKDGPKHVILLPPTHCLFCGSMVTVKSNMTSFPIVYTESEVYVAANYSGECRTCSTKPVYNETYYTISDDRTKFH